MIKDQSNTDSTPVLGTNDEALLLEAFSVFRELGNIKAAVNAASLHLSMSFTNPSYRPARLIIPSPDSKDNRWVIQYYVMNESEGELKRRRYYKIPKESDINKRKIIAQSIVEKINSLLAEGYMERIPSISVKPIGLLVWIDQYLNSKKHLRDRTKLNYQSELKTFVEFLADQKILKINSHNFTPKLAKLYFSWLKSSKRQHRTINNKMKACIGLFNYIVDLEQLDKNPFSSIKLLPKTTGRNIAFLPDQQQEIMNQLHLYPDLKLVVQFMYYSLMRTAELTSLKVENINQYKTGQIYLRKEFSKNGYERHIYIPDPLMKEIERTKLLEYPKNYYLFSTFKFGERGRRIIGPSPDKLGSKYIGEAFRNWVLNKLEYSKDYTLYSWKHTGVIAAHQAGVPDADIMQQTGHRNYSSFQVYMKSLGLFAKGEYAKRIPEI